MLRLRIPELLYEEDTIYINPKDDDEQMGMKDNTTKI